jgi:hypothetical protein
MARYDWKAKAYTFADATRLNYVFNPSFETGTANWSALTGSSLTNSTTDALYGTRSALSTSTGSLTTTGALLGTSNAPVAVAGEKWTGSAYVKMSAGLSPRNHRINLLWYNAGNALIATTNGGAVAVATAGGWVRLLVTGTAPANTAKVTISIEIQLTNAANGNATFIDGVLLEKTDTLKPYFDGSTTGSLPGERNNVFSWLGTANASVSQNVCQEGTSFALDIDDLQSISINIGRQQIQDPFKASTAVISGRNPQNLPAFTIGDTIELTVFQGGNSVSGLIQDVAFVGLVADIAIEYGNIQALDRYTINIEDALAVAGRTFTSTSFSWSAGITTFAAAEAVAADIGYTIENYYPTYTSGSTVSAQSPGTTNALQILNQLAATEQGRLFSTGYAQLAWVNRTALSEDASIVTFNPVDGSVDCMYEAVTFRSFADSYYEGVIVEPEGLTPQLFGSDGRTYTMKSYDQTTTQAGNLAAYVKATLEVNQAAPQSITAISEVQGNNTGLLAALQAGTGVRAELQSRMGIYDVIIEGATVTATPEQTRMTFNVVSADALNFFILDNATFGVLDQNRLGF